DAVGCQNARDFCAADQGFYQNLTPGPGGAPPSPVYLKGSNLRTDLISETGVLMLGPVPPGPNAVYQSNAAANGVTNFNVGKNGLAGNAFDTVIGGDGPPIYQYTNLRAPVDRKVVTATFNAALTDWLNMSVDGSW